MSITYGFYNSLNGDRKYDCSQLSKLFDGLIVDGIFASIGDCFIVKANGGLYVNVGAGKAWFNSTWTYNNSTLPIKMPNSEILQDRIDAVVIEINSSPAVRENSIKVIEGIPASTPTKPMLTFEDEIHQYPLCYIYRKAGSTEVTQADITNMIGSEETPFVTGILQTITLNELLGKWETELDLFVNDETAEFNEWFQGIRDTLDEDAATKLYNIIENEVWTIDKMKYGTVLPDTGNEGEVFFLITEE